MQGTNVGEEGSSTKPNGYFVPLKSDNENNDTINSAMKARAASPAPSVASRVSVQLSEQPLPISNPSSDDKEVSPWAILAKDTSSNAKTIAVDNWLESNSPAKLDTTPDRMKVTPLHLVTPMMYSPRKVVSHDTSPDKHESDLLLGMASPMWNNRILDLTDSPAFYSAMGDELSHENRHRSSRTGMNIPMGYAGATLEQAHWQLSQESIPTLENNHSVSTTSRGKCIVHQVQPKDTAEGISLQYGIKVSDLKRINRLWTTDSLSIRRKILIPLELCTMDRALDWQDSAVPFAEAIAIMSHLDNELPSEDSKDKSKAPSNTTDFLSSLDKDLERWRQHTANISTTNKTEEERRRDRFRALSKSQSTSRMEFGRTTSSSRWGFRQTIAQYLGDDSSKQRSLGNPGIIGKPAPTSSLDRLYDRITTYFGATPEMTPAPRGPASAENSPHFRRAALANYYGISPSQQNTPIIQHHRRGSSVDDPTASSNVTQRLQTSARQRRGRHGGSTASQTDNPLSKETE